MQMLIQVLSEAYHCFIKMFRKCSSYLSHVMRKPVYAICEQQRCKPAYAFAQSDQRLCCSLPRQSNTTSFYIKNFKPLASFCGWAGRFESYLVEKPQIQVFSWRGSIYLFQTTKLPRGNRQHCYWDHTAVFSSSTPGTLHSNSMR